MSDYHVNLVGVFALSCADLQLRAVRECGMRPADASALLAVHSRPGSSAGDIAVVTDLTHSGAVRAIDRLEARSLIERNAASDRRELALACTPAGRDAAERLLAARRDAVRNLLEGLDDGERELLAGLSGKLLAQLTTDQLEAWRICRFCEHDVCVGDDCPVGSGVRNASEKKE